MYADQVGAAGVAAGRGDVGPFLAADRDAAVVGAQHAGDQPEQRALAAAARAMHEQLPAVGDRERADGQRVVRGTGPAVAEVADVDHGGAGGVGAARCTQGQGRGPARR
jgi:hypothetical protein